MKYRIYLILTIVILVLLQGCADINADFSLFPDNSVSSEISIDIISGEIDKKDRTDAYEKMALLGAFFEQNGYTVTFDSSTDKWNLTAVLFNKYENAAAASDAFEKLLKSDLGIFSSFSFFSRISKTQSAYYFSGQFDAKTLLAENQISSLPTDISTRLNNYLSGRLGNITVRLPASTAVYSDPKIEISNNLATVTAPVYFDSPVNITIETTVNGEPPNISDSGLQERMDYADSTILMTKYIAAGCGVLIFVIIILMLVLNKKRKYV